MTEFEKTIITPEIWQNLLSPISSDTPSGTPIHYDPLYDAIQKARYQEDERLPQGIWQRDVKQADWNTVEKLCLQVLMTRSKDLHIVAWLTEAWLVRFQIPGLMMGLKLYTALCENFWETLYPSLEQTLDYRLSPLNWMNEKLPERLIHIPIGITHDKNVPILFYRDWIIASTQKDQGKPKSNLKTQELPAITLAQFKALQSQVPQEFYQQFLEQLHQSMSILTDLEALIVTHDANQTHSLNRLDQELKKIAEICQQNMPQVKVESGPLQARIQITGRLDDPVEKLQPGGSTLTLNLISSAQASELMKTRAQAYHLLQQAADVLSIIEPHSPTPYLIKRAIAWDDMPLTKVMQEITQDDALFKRMQQFLGMTDTKDSK